MSGSSTKLSFCANMQQTIKLMKPPLDKINGRRPPANDRKIFVASSFLLQEENCTKK